ncbi:MAG: hypothetical protein EKK41_22905 [Hyphomicrobiales bacterium]|nr:MAG: hypothetical protein EKK41_22905 [Hyphomicrobiales bacterium]
MSGDGIQANGHALPGRGQPLAFSELLEVIYQVSSAHGEERWDALRTAAFFAGECVGRRLIDKADVVDKLQMETTELVAEFGVDRVQQEIAASFAKGEQVGTSDVGETEGDIRPPEYSDDALALAVAELHHERLRYVSPWDKWMHWNGKNWRCEDTLLAWYLVRQLARGMAAACASERTSMHLTSAKTISAGVRLARSDRRLAATVDQWDADPMLLNTPGGVVDLRTGRRRPNDPNLYLTRITAVAPGGHCPTWLAFLDRVTGGDRELQSYLQRVAGYSCTGLTREQALFFVFGHGGNGKGVLVNTFAGVLGNYATSAASETFTASRSERHLTEIADLHGARFVYVAETEEGREWAEARIKQLTGGDRVKARFMRQDFFEFAPQFKLLISGNHKPKISSADEAIIRRLQLIPFSVTIPRAERDPTLAERLRKEWPGILEWAINGCLEWQARGLDPPAAVREASAAYLADEDPLSAWISDRCALGANNWERSAALFASWTAFAEAEGEKIRDQRWFKEALARHGIEAKRDGRKGRYFQGISLK